MKDEKKISTVSEETSVVEFVTLKNLTRFKTNADEQLEKKIKEHTHTPEQIVETAEKKFVAQTEKDRWNNTYTKTETYTKVEVDNKLSGAIGGLAFKGVFENLSALPQESNKDGDYAIVTNEPTAEGKNLLVVYESAGEAGWKNYGSLILPGKATASLDGLMSKEQVTALTTAVADIVKLKSGEAITALEASKVTQDAQHRFVTDEEKTNYADKYTKTETDGKIDEAKGEASKVNQALEAYKSSNDARVQAVEEKLNKIATDEQIDAIFGKKK